MGNKFSATQVFVSTDFYALINFYDNEFYLLRQLLVDHEVQRVPSFIGTFLALLYVSLLQYYYRERPSLSVLASINITAPA